MMKIEKPIVFFDVETTGLDISKDRIIELSEMGVKNFATDKILPSHF